MKRVTSILVVLALILAVALSGCGNSAGGGKSSSRYFKTPEAAAEYFIDCIRKGDVEGALAAFPIDERVEGNDFAAESERMVVVQPTISSNLPPADRYPYYEALAREGARADTVTSIRSFVYSLSDIMDCMDNYAPITRSRLRELGLDDWDDLAQEYDPSRAQALTILELCSFRDMTGDFETSEEVYQQYQENGEEMALTRFGSDDLELEGYHVLCRSGRQTYYCSMEFLKFPKGWKLKSLCCPLNTLANLNTPIIPISKDTLRMLQDGMDASR